MNTNSTFIQRYSLPTYLFLTPLISLAIALFLPIPIVLIVLLLLLVPSTLAILLTGLSEGRKSVAGLLKKVFQWRISFKWYGITLLLSVGVLLLADVLAFLVGWSPKIQFHIPAISQLTFNFILIVLVAVLEELGWRGYALPRLLARRSHLASALLIGIAHGILHIGIGLVDGRPWLPTFLNPLALSIILTWMFLHTRGSLAMAILYHFAYDYSAQFFLFGLTNSQGVWAQTIVHLAIAFVLILLFGVNLQRSTVNAQSMAEAG